MRKFLDHPSVDKTNSSEKHYNNTWPIFSLFLAFIVLFEKNNSWVKQTAIGNDLMNPLLPYEKVLSWRNPSLRDFLSKYLGKNMLTLRISWWIENKSGSSQKLTFQREIENKNGWTLPLLVYIFSNVWNDACFKISDTLACKMLVEH